MSAVNHRDRQPREVKQMFSRIALRYDLLNHLLSFGLDFRWRKKVSEQTARTECRRILDVCTGTGDMAISLCHYWKGKAHIDAIDFSPELLAIGTMKTKKAGVQDFITFREANAEHVPFSDESFDAVTIAFGLRNIQDRRGGIGGFSPGDKVKGLLCLPRVQSAGEQAFFLHVLFLSDALCPCCIRHLRIRSGSIPVSRRDDKGFSAPLATEQDDRIGWMEKRKLRDSCGGYSCHSPGRKIVKNRGVRSQHLTFDYFASSGLDMVLNVKC